MDPNMVVSGADSNGTRLQGPCRSFPFTPFHMGKRLPSPISTAYRRWSRDPLPSPTSPLERSPNGWKNRESDGVGLGIVVALDKSSSSELSSKVVVNFHRVLSPPIPISNPSPAGVSSSRFDGHGCGGKRTRRCRNKDGFWEDGCGEMGIFYTSPPRSAAESSGFPVSGFLSTCYLCRKKLDGKDIYMYRGEKAFCSIDCRYRQIVADEYQESCGYAASRPSEISSPVDYSAQKLVHTGIMAA